MLFKAAFALVAALANISAACASPPPVYNEELQGIMQRGVAEFKVKFQGGSGMQAVELKDGTQNNKERILRKLGDTNELTYTGRVIVVAGEPRRQHKGNGESDVYLERALVSAVSRHRSSPVKVQVLLACWPI